MKTPVITIDGPGGSGKGTLALQLAKALQWRYLDSGVLYRALGLLAQKKGVDAQAVEGLVALATDMQLEFKLQSTGPAHVFLENQEITQAVRTEKAGAMASKVSQHSPVRAALMALQRAFQKAPGLVTDGRDMGTVVFPQASLKIYLDASVGIRAERRFKELQAMGVDVKLSDLVQELKDRDQRDQERAVSPLKPAEDGVIIDTSECSKTQILDQVMALVAEKGLLA